MSLLARDRSGWVTRWNAGPDRPCDPAAHIRAALAEAAAGGGGQVVLWVERADASLDSAARAAGMQHWRTLLQMRRALPATPSTLHTRAFTEADADAFIALNNRAFSWHPEQGGWTPQHLALHYTEPWFCADGFRVHERDGQLAAVCWTKIHPACAALDDPQLGEVYVAAVDPALQRQGLGAQVTLAGLQWLSERGVATAVLYVEHDNTAARRTYERIGFEVHHADHAYRASVVGGGGM